MKDPAFLDIKFIDRSKLNKRVTMQVTQGPYEPLQYYYRLARKENPFPGVNRVYPLNSGCRDGCCRLIEFFGLYEKPRGHELIAHPFIIFLSPGGVGIDCEAEEIGREILGGLEKVKILTDIKS